MKVVKVDGNVFLGNFAEGVLSEAMEVNGSRGSLTADVRGQLGKYVMARNVGKLMEMQVGTHSAVASRDLTAEENIVLATAEQNLEVAKTQAVRNLENEYFEANF